MSGESACPAQAELFGLEPGTQIAAELHRHFTEGGSISDGIKLVEVLERAETRSFIAPRSRISEAKRGSRLPADWRPSSAEISFAVDRGMAGARPISRLRNSGTIGQERRRCDEARLERNLAELDHNSNGARQWPCQL
jgi:hypothetical protein